jgi:hypothetical protein
LVVGERRGRAWYREFGEVNGVNGLLSRITYQGPVAPESHVDYAAAGSLGRNFDSAACWRRAR